MTLSELKSQLSEIEPTESMYRGIGAAEVPLLRQLLEDKEAWVAARAVDALSRIDTPEAHASVAEAARSPRPELRVAAAVNAPKLSLDQCDRVLDVLLDDTNVGVRKFAISSVSERNSLKVKEKLRSIANSDADRMLRQLARDHLGKSK